MRALCPTAIHVVPIAGPHGELSGELCVGLLGPRSAWEPDDLVLFEELGRRAGLALENARLYREAQKAIESRDAFLGLASHELRTPLTSMALQAAMLERATPTGSASAAERAQAQFGARIRRQVRRLERLIDSLLDVSRIAGGHLQLDRQETDLAALAADVAEQFAEDHLGGPSLGTHLQPGVVGHWDRLRLEQVLTNLLSNAAKYGAGKPIDLVVEGDERCGRVRVRDQGIGIAPEDLSRLFKRFERLVSERHYAGIGLGLWITRQMVEAHHGTITVESEPDRGTTFTVELPRRTS
jgi:signal transduction histidine kinase